MVKKTAATDPAMAALLKMVARCCDFRSYRMVKRRDDYVTAVVRVFIVVDCVAIAVKLCLGMALRASVDRAHILVSGASAA